MKFLKKLELIEEYFTFVLFLAGILISLYGVFMRYVVHSPKYGLSDLIEIAMVWSIFIGLARALKANQHIAVEILFDKLPFGLKRIVGAFSNFLGAAYCFYLFIGGVNLVAVAYSNGYTTETDHIPIWFTYLVLPVGMFLLSMYFLVKMIKAIIGDQAELAPVSEVDAILEEENLKNDRGAS